MAGRRGAQNLRCLQKSQSENGFGLWQLGQLGINEVSSSQRSKLKLLQVPEATENSSSRPALSIVVSIVQMCTSGLWAWWDEKGIKQNQSCGYNSQSPIFYPQYCEIEKGKRDKPLSIFSRCRQKKGSYNTDSHSIWVWWH